ncbi:MAG: sensor histidine kinase [Sphingobacteriales bacterium]|nr:sensor histidine kinase [Sphingobacteriales bacterium]
MKKLFLQIIFLGVIIYPYNLLAQSKITDSLLKALASETSVKQKGRLHIKIGKEYISVDTLKAKDNFEKGLAFANNANDDMGKGAYHLYTAYLYCDKGKYNDGLAEFNNASQLLNQFLSGKNFTTAEKEEADGMLLDAELSRGNVFLELYEYDKAVEMFWQVLALINKTNFPDKNLAVASTYQSIALAYYHQAQYQTALRYYLQSLPYAEKAGNEEFVALTNVYTGMCYTLIKKYDSTAVFLKRAEPVATASHDVTLKTMFYARSAELAMFTGNHSKAVMLYDSAIHYASVTGNIYMQATFTDAKAESLLKLNKISEAKQTALRALALARSINKKREIIETQRVLSAIEAAAGNYNEAYWYLLQSKLGKDSLNTAELTEKIEVLDKKYQSKLKEEKIAQLQKDKELQQLNIDKKNLLNYFLAGASVALLVISILVYRNYRNKQTLQQQRIAELETEKKLAATEAVLTGEEKERTRLAKDLHDGLGGMLSGIKYSLNTMKGNLIMTPENAQAFERSMDMLDSSIKEMRRVAHNMMPETLVKFGLNTALKDFCNDVNQSGALKVNYQSIGADNLEMDNTTAIIIYRIVQELLNNTMKHAAATNAIVQLTKTDGVLAVTVEDDGKGFDTTILKQSKGIGWDNIQHRVEFLKGKLDVNSLPGNGTSVNIEFVV